MCARCVRGAVNGARGGLLYQEMLVVERWKFGRVTGACGGEAIFIRKNNFVITLEMKKIMHVIS